jgi:hypothetical protein
MRDERTSQAVELMTEYTSRTGIGSPHTTPRYLWTDAFAVCNLLGLARITGDERHHELALELVDEVHRQLGRHRGDDLRTGWLSGLSDAEGELHPTRGGLRIGKPLRERTANEPLDSSLEWDRDGQYFHYLTKWMHALDQTTRATAEPKFNVWARELAVTAHHAFTYGSPPRKRMAWKLSIDLSRPLVPSMGQHDPLDGFVTCTQLDATAAELGIDTGPALAEATSDFAAMLDREGLATADPLGLGAQLVDACRLAQLDHPDHDLVAALLGAAFVGLRHYVTEPDLQGPAHHRLAFRELGLAIGLAGLSMFDPEAIPELARYLPLRDTIESFWLQPGHRRVSTWIDHTDINQVMLATSLAPEGFLVLTTPKRVTPEIQAAHLHP